MEENARKKVNCIQCRHFHITWNPKFPRGCKLHGFMTAKYPSATVFESTGTDCLGFEPKGAKSSDKNAR